VIFEQHLLRRPVTDIALLSYIAKKRTDVISYTEAVKACKSSSSASRALHQLIGEGLIETKPKLLGLRYVTQYVVTPRGKQVSNLALQLSELREISSRSKSETEAVEAKPIPSKEIATATRKVEKKNKKNEKSQN
jgi:DNA-binding MarR family transcriptional regulator